MATHEASTPYLLTLEGDPVPPELRPEPEESPEAAAATPRRQTVAAGRVLRHRSASGRTMLAGAFAAALMAKVDGDGSPEPRGLLSGPEPTAEREPTPQQRLAHEVAAAVDRVAASRRAAPRWLRSARRDLEHGERGPAFRATAEADQDAILRAVERRALRAEKRRRQVGP
jgi:hypothetical protein